MFLLFLFFLLLFIIIFCFFRINRNYKQFNNYKTNTEEQIDNYKQRIVRLESAIRTLDLKINTVYYLELHYYFHFFVY